ncbi:MAG: SCP2 sterol-binding domain-containing protein [Acidimicrobiales bacterium]
MSDFLSDEWLRDLSETLNNAGPAPLDEGANELRLVFELTDGPSSSTHAVTFAVTREGVSVTAGDHLAADAVIRISYRDAESLATGTLTSANAVRDGRLKIRGDVHGLVPLLAWLLGARAT